MPNKRAAGTVVTSFAAPAELLDRARTKAAGEGKKLGEVIRAALTRYVEEEKR